MRIPLIPWKLTSSEHWMNFFSVFVSLMTYLGYIFLLDVSIFTTIDDEKCKNQSFKYFEGFYLKLRRKFWKFINTQKIQLHTNSEDISEIKLTSLLPFAQNSHLITWTLLVLNIFFYPNNRLAPYQILSYQELNVVVFIRYICIKFYFLSLSLQYCWF